MIKRKKTKQIFVGNVPIGGNADIAVQSMCNTPTWDVEKNGKSDKRTGSCRLRNNQSSCPR